MSSIQSDEISSIATEVLKPHGQEYQIIEDLNIDPKANLRYSNNARFNFPAGEGFEEYKDIDRPIAEYFYLLFPMPIINQIIRLTNLEIRSTEYPDYLRVDLTKGEFFKWIGIKLAMVLTPLRGGIDAYFAVESEPGTVYEPGNYGKRFGMSKNITALDELLWGIPGLLAL